MKSFFTIISRKLAAVGVAITIGFGVNFAYADLDYDLLGAANSGDLAGVEKFLADGADIETKSNWGSTPLVLAAKNGHFHIVKYLVESGADVNFYDSGRGLTVLMVAATSLVDNLDTVKYLVANGADIRALDFLGNSVIDYVVRPKLSTASDERHNEMVAFLKEQYENPSSYGIAEFAKETYPAAETTVVADNAGNNEIQLVAYNADLGWGLLIASWFLGIIGAFFDGLFRTALRTLNYVFAGRKASQA